ncbi:zinc-ribbon domain-containing protein [Lacticaseibacillus paracasei]
MAKTTKICWNCGAKVPRYAKFCTKCGADLRKKE